MRTLKKLVIFALELAVLGGAGVLASNRAIGGLINRPCCAADAGVADGGARR